jgi:predicted nucleic acid-binding protein
VEAIRRARPPLILSPFVLAEVDYLLASRIGVDEEFAFLAEVAGGAYQLEPFGSADVAAAHAVVERYRDLELGLADASLVVLAERLGTTDVLTLDRRHFSALRMRKGKRFRLLPDDAGQRPRRKRG